MAAEYPESADAGAFILLAEVSAQRVMSDKEYDEQLDSALTHANEETKKSPGMPVYCLLVNNRRIFEDSDLHLRYREFLQKNELDAESDIRIVPIHATDFGVMTGTLSAELTLDEMYFSPSVLSNALDALYKAILRPTLPSRRIG